MGILADGWLPGEIASPAFYALIGLGTMMGATLPLLARHAVEREGEVGARVGLLYGVNTAGAVAGTLLGLALVCLVQLVPAPPPAA